MLIHRLGYNAIKITIENMSDWMVLFDNGRRDEISIELNLENLVIFFPGWKTYVDSKNINKSLRNNDINCIEHIRVETLWKNVSERANLYGNCTYDVTGCEFSLYDKTKKEDCKETTIESLIDFTGIVTFKIYPNHPEP